MSKGYALDSLLWIEELLPREVIPEPMNDGIGYFLEGKLILILVESSKTRIYRGQEYGFQIWNGCLFPIEKIKQNAVIRQFLFLENHPALPNCLYLPAEDEDFNEHVISILKELKKNNPLFGITPKIKKTYQADDADSDTSRPSLFQDVPKNAKKTVAEKINPATKKPKTIKKIKADKKSENSFLLGMLKKKI